MPKTPIQEPRELIRPAAVIGRRVYYNFEAGTIESVADGKISEVRNGYIISGIGGAQDYLFNPLPEVVRISVIFQGYYSRLRRCFFLHNHAVHCFLVERWRISVLEYYLTGGRPGMHLEDLTGLDVEAMLSKLRKMAEVTVQGVPIVYSPNPF